MTRSAPRRSRPLSLLLCATFIAAGFLPGLAIADDEERGDWYVEYMAGVSHAPNQTLRSTDAAPTLMGSTESDPVGYFVGGAIGRRFADAFRGEIQIGYRSTEIERLAVRGEPNDSKDSTLSLFTAMVNGYFDLDLGDDVPVTPWVGLGLGWGMPRLDGENTPGANQFDVDDTDSVFVYNAMVGATIPISEITEINLGYRYLRTEDFEIGGTSGGALRRFDFEYDAHEAYVGARFSF